MKLITPWLLAFCCIFTTSAYQLSLPPSAVSTALGGCLPTLSETDSRLSANVTLLNLYGIPELSHLQGQLYVKTPVVAIGLTARHFGLSGYGESAVGLGFGKKFSPFLSMAVRGYWIHIAWPSDAKPVNTGLLETEFFFHPHRKLTLGLHLFNLSFTSYKTLEGRFLLPVHFRMGCCYRFSDQLLASMELDKELYGSLGFHTGCQYSIAKRIDLRVGIELYTSLSPTGGIGIRFKRFICDIGCKYDWKLGLQSAIGLQFFLP